ncbi:MAG: hypothetical protein V2A58_05045 [Planctomycetota bacterium]
MRICAVLVGMVLVLALMGGCGSKESEEAVQAPTPAPEDTVAGPVEYIETVIGLGTRQDYRTKKLTVEEAVQQYHAMKTAYPASVEDLVREGLLVKVPSLDEGDRWAINHETGEVTIMRKTRRQR